MKYKYYESFNEHLYYKELNNGLKVYLIPKNDFHKTFVTFTTKYGSFDLSFIPIGKTRKVNQPAGIAHFLEHKLFAMPDKTDAFEQLSKFGVSGNAFTSFDRTAYLFSGTENVKEALIYLLDFVQIPYFTASSVKKEQGIIEEELLMYQNYPNQRLFYGILKNLYKKHPINTEVIGTQKSIYEITPHKLYQAYNTFYHPSNMTLILVGNFDPEELINVIEENQNSKEFKKEDQIKRFYPKEPLAIAQKEQTIEMSVQIPYVGIGVKLRPEQSLKEQVKSYYALNILLDMYFSQSSDNYEKLLKAGLIDKSFNASAIQAYNALNIIISVMTNKTDEFVEQITKILVNIKRQTIKDDVLERIKRGHQGSFIRDLNSVENINLAFLEATFNDIDLFEIPNIIDSITKEDLIKLARQIKKEYITYFHIVPKK